MDKDDVKQKSGEPRRPKFWEEGLIYHFDWSVRIAS
jgi:hypothetical protein